MLIRWIIAAIVSIAIQGTSFGYAAPPPAEAFGKLPAIAEAAISPNGQSVALVVNENDKSALAVMNSETGAISSTILLPRFIKNAKLTWYDENYLLMSYRMTVLTRYINLDTDFYDLCGYAVVSLEKKQAREMQLRACGIVSMQGPEPLTILLPAGLGPGRSVVYKVRLDEVKYREVVRGATQTRSWIGDTKGNVRLREDVASGQKQVWARLSGSEDWKLVYTGPYYERGGGVSDAGGDEVSFLGFGDDSDQVFVQTYKGNTPAISMFDLKTRVFTASVFQDPRYSDYATIRLRTNKIVGVEVTRETREQVFFDAAFKSLQSEVRSAFPGERVSIESSTDDMSRHILYSENDRAPGGEYLLLDMKTGDAKNIGYRYPRLTKGALAAPKFVSYPARDGTQIPAFLTLPVGNAKPRAAVVLVHGGPAARDTGDFDYMAQFLASRGYAVLQPQYRGSEGYGDAWEYAGHGQWGKRMQDDVSEAVPYLIKQGVDAGRVCIAGFSYGGYAALLGAALTPDLFKCAIGGAGVYDLVDILKESERDSWVEYAYWRTHMGDIAKDPVALAAISPVKLAERIKAPILLLHGDRDAIVPVRQSQAMTDALKAAGKSYSFVKLENDDHHLTFEKTRVRTLKAMEDFLIANNPP